MRNPIFLMGQVREEQVRKVKMVINRFISELESHSADEICRCYIIDLEVSNFEITPIRADDLASFRLIQNGGGFGILREMKTSNEIVRCYREFRALQRLFSIRNLHRINKPYSLIILLDGEMIPVFLDE